MGAIRPVISFSAEGCYLFIEVEMSWQAYVDTQMIQKNLKQAAIAGHDGNIWAKSADFNISNDDIKKLLNNYENWPRWLQVGSTWQAKSTSTSAGPTRCCVVSRARAAS